MKVELLNSDYATVSFANQCKVSLRGGEDGVTRDYDVHWSRRQKSSGNYEPVGLQQLSAGRWGAFDYEDVEQWRVDFFHEGKKVSTFDNNLANKPVIIIAKTASNKAGKTIDFAEIKKYCSNVVNEFNCDLKVYFQDSCKFDFSNVKFNPLRLNDKITDMYFGLEKEF